MQRNAMFGQLLALMAAAVMVMTAIYIYILWRNQSPDRVMNLASGQILYRTNEMAIGSSGPTRNNSDITLLRFTTEGGWVSAGTGHFLSVPKSRKLAEIAFIPNNSVELAGAEWLCALQKSTQVTAIELVDTARPNKQERFEFHNGGIVEPVLINHAVTIRGLHDGQTVFSALVSLPALEN